MALDNKIKTFNIDKKQNIFDLKAKQNDTTGARSFIFKLIKNNQVFNLEGLKIVVGGNKADGKNIFNDVKILNAAKGIVEMELSTQMLTTAGLMNLELILMQGEIRLSTIPFQLEIIPSVTGYKAIISSDEFKVLTEALTKVDEWDKTFTETSGKIEEKYTERLNSVSSQLSEIESSKLIVSATQPSEHVKGRVWIDIS